jgi:hypothetical protein
MKEKIQELKDINYKGLVDLKDLDEHSIDAIAVAYGCYKDVTNENF